MTLRYMIIGAGGTGAPLGAFLAKTGADVTLIARGAHLAAIQEKGLRFEQSDGETWTVPVKAFDMDGFLAAKAQGAPSPDVIFVCVKGYSLDDTIPFIRSAAGEKTVVIPILNIYGTGRTMQAAAPRSARDRRLHLHLVQPQRPRRHSAPRLDFPRDLRHARPPHGQSGTLSGRRRPHRRRHRHALLPFVEKDTLLKFSHVSPMAACGQYYHVKAGAMQKPGEIRECFIRLVGEILELARAMGHRAG